MSADKAFDKFHKRFRHLDRNDARIAWDAGLSEGRAALPAAPAPSEQAALESMLDKTIAAMTSSKVMPPPVPSDTLIFKLEMAQNGSCSCVAKTHEVAYHAENCLYRVLDEAIAALAARQAPTEAPKEPLAWCLLSIGDKIVYLNESRAKVAEEQPFFKTPTTIEGIVLARQAPDGMDTRDAALEQSATICDGLAKLYDSLHIGYDNGYTMAATRAAEEIRALKSNTQETPHAPR